ncbi:hypothetical protein [Sinorhizobium sp. NFACC03]|uniref:hypothetical protein n=1 Tax=Sinorhizobium sp. NFACC03 TaxID=1566295 RepID=UPI00087F4490|nr:hypothetical protein [Sinorhizobium sp. NFACC03]SDA93672.1 hypothetical protein SAMN03159448_05032 [Sinorhizobium sp. NFACC03]
MKRLALATSLMLVVQSSPARSEPLVRWDWNDKGFWIYAINPDDRSWNCAAEYAINYAGDVRRNTASFTLPPKFKGVMSVVKVDYPASQWSFEPGGAQWCN